MRSQNFSDPRAQELCVRKRIIGLLIVPRGAAEYQEVTGSGDLKDNQFPIIKLVRNQKLLTNNPTGLNKFCRDSSCGASKPPS
jgi:hypothetical protein